MNSKILLLSIAVISVGLFAMPSTLSLFAGQHTFDKAGNTTICAKCHSDIISEINNGAFHKSLITAGSSGNECKGCHTTATVAGNLIQRGNQTGNGSATVFVGLNLGSGNFTQANGTNYSVGLAHAAVTVECVSCHYAVVFTNDAHKEFADNTSSMTYLKGSNEACIGCHTKSRMEITWVRKGGYNFTFDFQNQTGSYAYNVTNVNSSTNNTN
ncbi:MAG: NapC/NirT family cytochrome c [Candidatus Methanoperedens sp.]|nr:NapC/NirT family cytochrome c [Candidatus Methanoperedens sp.]